MFFGDCRGDALRHSKPSLYLQHTLLSQITFDHILQFTSSSHDLNYNSTSTAISDFQR